MRKEAIEVVEAARRLGIRLDQRRPTGFVIDSEEDAFLRGLVEVAEAIERFDRAGGESIDPTEVGYRKALGSVFKWMRSKGIELEEPARVAMDALESAAVLERDEDGEEMDEQTLRHSVEALVLKPKPGDLGPQDEDDPDDPFHDTLAHGYSSTTEELEARLSRAQRAMGAAQNMARSVRSRASAATDIDPRQKAAFVMRAVAIGKSAEHALETATVRAEATPRGPSAPSSRGSVRRVGAEVGYAPTVSDYEDHVMAIDAMMDKLEFAVSKVGWTPKLRALAVAWRNAQDRATPDHLHDGPAMRIPVADWAVMGKAVTEVALDQKTPQPAVIPRAPEPKPEPQPEPEQNPVLPTLRPRG